MCALFKKLLGLMGYDSGLDFREIHDGELVNGLGGCNLALDALNDR